MTEQGTVAAPGEWKRRRRMMWTFLSASFVYIFGGRWIAPDVASYQAIATMWLGADITMVAGYIAGAVVDDANARNAAVATDKKDPAQSARAGLV